MKKNTMLFLCAIIFAAFANGQSPLTGKISDASSHPISGVSVHVLNSNYSAVSNGNGEFRMNNILPGQYTLEFTAIGFATKNFPLVLDKNSQGITITLDQTSKRLDEIVVTAEKKEALLQNIPISITALSAKKVNDYRLWNSKEITAIVPNLYSGDPGDKRNVTSIRGITTTSYDPAVATYIDGVNQFGLDTYISPLFDVERIEILRGPQGTLYGRNAMSGVINIITKQPTNKTTGFAEITFGNHGQQRYSAGIKSPLIKDKLFIGIAGLYDAFNGFYTNEFNNSKYDKQHSVSGNYYLKYLPNAKWAATLNVKHNNNRNTGPFPLVFGKEDAFANPYKLSQNALTKIIDDIFNTSLSLNYSGTGFNFNSQTSYQTNYRYYKTPIDADFSPYDALTLNNNYGKKWNTVKVFTQEFKFSSPANNLSKLNWTVGTYFFHQASPTKAATRFGNDVDPDNQNSSVINTSKAKGSGIAVYGQATYNLTNKIDLTAGVRYDYEHKKQSALGQYQKDPNPNPIFDLRTDTTATTDYSAFQPKVSIAFHTTDNSLLFITYSKGYRAGGLTPFVSTDPNSLPLYAFKPEYSNNVEAGMKNSFLQNKLLVNLTAFFTKVTNAQVPTLILPDAVTITKNTGKLTSKGFEAEINATPAKGFEINYSFGYTNSKYDKLKVPQDGAEVNLKGTHQIFTPDVTSMMAAQYAIPLSKKKPTDIVVRGEWKYLGTQYFDLNNTIKQSPYSLFNTRIGITTKYADVMFFARNIFGKKYIGYAYDFGAIHLGDPATYGVSARVSL